MVKTYYSLTKPGIIWGNLIAATGGFMLAAKGNPNLLLYILTMLGVALVVASGCVFNNVIDADIDSNMQRTNQRAMVLGHVSENSALVFATLLSICAFCLIAVVNNLITLIFAVLGFTVYVVFYTLMYKRNSVHGTVVGSISGACPPVMGYVAITNEIDFAAIIIFLAFCAWQMPHTYAIALFRKTDYQTTNIPLLPLIKSIKITQQYMLCYIVLFLIACFALFIKNYIGLLAIGVLSFISMYWIYQAIFLYKKIDNEFTIEVWGKKMFITSIIAITLFSLMIGVDYIPNQSN